MKKLYDNFFSPTPAHLKKWQKLLLSVGGLGTIIALGGSMYDWIPDYVVKAMGTCTLLGTFLLQFGKQDEEIQP